MVFSFLFCIFAIKIVLNKQNMKQFNLEEYLANPSRKVVTRDGRTVKIYCTDYVDGPIIAKIEGDTYSNSFREDGRYVDYEETNNDLFFAPEKHEGWANIFKGTYNDNRLLGHSRIFKSKEDAEEAGEECSGYITSVKIEWEE